MASVKDGGLGDNRGKGSRRRRIAGRILGVLIVLTLVAAGGVYAVYRYRLENTTETAYAAGKGRSVNLYEPTDDGSMGRCGSVTRGSEVEIYSFAGKVTEEDVTYRKIAGEDESYIREDALAASADDVVRETDVWVRTPVTIYAEADGPAIGGFAEKGTHLDVTGYDRLLDDGRVNKYRVKYLDSKDKTREGYVYSKYLVNSGKKAEKYYNKNGEYDAAKKDRYGFELYGGRAEHLDYYPYERTSIEGNEFLDDARAMYLNAYAGTHPKEYLKIIDKTDCNAVVIDLKDGPLTYKSEVAKEWSPTSYKNAYTSENKLKKAVDQYREAGVYLIGRIVVFNDPYYAKDHPEDCIKYKGSKSWPSGYSRDVWEYNVRLAREAARKFGFNEIQFDYVRFPESTYEMSKSGKTDFRNKYGEEKAQAIQNFIFYAADQLRDAGVYISIDVFGESAYGYVTAYGQYWTAIANIADAISAMPYTDHFAADKAWETPYDTMLTWSKRAARQQKKIQDPAAARTWITGYNTPYWAPAVNYNAKMLKAQIRALRDAGLEGGFIPWNVLSDTDKYNQYRSIWNDKS